MSRALRTIAEIDAAARDLAATWPPLTQEQADHAAALLDPYLPRMTAAQAAPTAA